MQVQTAYFMGKRKLHLTTPVSFGIHQKFHFAITLSQSIVDEFFFIFSSPSVNHPFDNVDATFDSSVSSTLSRPFVPSLSVLPLYYVFIMEQFGNEHPFATGCIRRDYISRGITVCLVWLMRTDSEQRYYWSSRDTLEKYAAPTVFTVVLGLVWHCDAKAKEAWTRRWLKFIPAYDLHTGLRERAIRNRWG